MVFVVEKLVVMVEEEHVWISDGRMVMLVMDAGGSGGVGDCADYCWAVIAVVLESLRGKLMAVRITTVVVGLSCNSAGDSSIEEHEFVDGGDSDGEGGCVDVDCGDDCDSGKR